MGLYNNGQILFFGTGSQSSFFDNKSILLRYIFDDRTDDGSVLCPPESCRDSPCMDEPNIFTISYS